MKPLGWVLLGLGVLIIITFVLCLYLLKPKKMRVYIPKDIYICYKTVEDLPPEVVNRWKRLNPEYKVHVYGDAECRSFIEETYGKAYADFFASIPSGPIKADFWRVCILYAKGGVYADADIEPLVPIGDFLEEGIELCTCSTYKGNPNLSINPHLLIAKPHHPLLKKCIDLMFEKRKLPFDYWSYSITRIMYQVLKEAFPSLDPQSEGLYKNLQILEEVWPRGAPLCEVYCVYKGKPVLKNHHSSYNSRKHTF